MNHTSNKLRYDTHPIIPAKRLKDLPEVRKALNDFKGQRLRDAQQTQDRPLSHLAHRLLNEASLHPWTPVARLWDSIGQTPAYDRQTKIRKELDSLGFADFEEVRLGRANVLLIQLTERGWKHLRLGVPRKSGRGGMAHQHVCHWIVKAGKLHGTQMRLEWIIPGTNHPVDVAQPHGSRWSVYEVAVTARHNLASHLRACFVESDVVDTLTIVTLQKKISDRVRKAIQKDPFMAQFLDRINFEVAETFVKELWP